MQQMNRNKVFLSARWQLALWYAGAMGMILCLSGMGAYQMMAHAHWQGLDRELEAVAGTLHDSLEPALQQPAQINSSVRKVLPNICLVQQDCGKGIEDPGRHILGAVQQDGYYVRFLDLSGRQIATVGKSPPGIPFKATSTAWQTLEDGQGDRYHQLSIPLKTESRLLWGYMQVGRSLKDYDKHLDESKQALLLGLPMALLLVSIASWYLAGMAMRPVYHSYHKVQQFTADVTHELRTPLAAIRATVESAGREDFFSETEIRDILKTVERQVIRLSQLVQDLLLLSRLDFKAIQWKWQLCCLNDIAIDLVEELAALAVAAEIDLKLDIRTARSLDILGDEEQLYRLVANLITNAIQYTPTGGKVTVILDGDDRQAAIQVRDTGIGIAPENLSRIFDRFYRVSSDRSRATGGSGLGLAIAQAIAQAHRGDIQVKSEPGKGSIFTIYLPLKADR